MNNVIVYDFETNNKNPHIAEPVELGAVVIDTKRLMLLDDDTFFSEMKPLHPEVSESEETVKFHSENLKKSPEKIKAGWENNPHPKVVWKSFVEFCQKYKIKGRGTWGCLIRGGHNITNFDDIITQRMCQLYGPKEGFKGKLFHPVHYIDSYNLSFLWMDSLSNIQSYSMDSLRDYLGMSAESKEFAHNALQDTLDTARLIMRYLRLFRREARSVKFKDSFKHAM